MSPEPYVRQQALAAAAAFVAASILGPPAAALACAIAAAAGASWLARKYRRDIERARVTPPPHRERLDQIVAGDARAVFGIALTGSALLTAFGGNPPDIGLAEATPVLVAGTASVIYLSSLVDWYVILPRLSGLLGCRPCRRGPCRQPSFPRTWRETTRWWYIHRIVAFLGLRFGAALAVALSLEAYIDLPRGAGIVAGAILVVFAAYLAAIPRAVMEAGHPSAIVGDTVYVRTARRRPLKTVRILGKTVAVPSIWRTPEGPLGAREYVFDVAVEKVQFVDAASRERDPSDRGHTLLYERHPRNVHLRELAGCESAREPFAGCESGCSGISWYCIENPECFDLK
jgi:hypothetical protein